MSSGADVKSRKGPLFWVLTGGVVFLVLLFGGLAFIGYHGASTHAPGSFAGFQGLRTFAGSSTYEILEEDPAAETIRFRNKKTGQEYFGSIDPDTHQVKIVELVNAPAPATGK